MKWLHSILAIIFPERCVLCRSTSINGICLECISALPRANIKRCYKCGNVSSLSECPCLSSEYHFFRMAACSFYDGTMKEVIGELKYKKQKNLAKPLGVLLGMFFRDELCWSGVECIVPIPLYNDAFYMRGFNQSELLARAMGTELNIPVHPELLIKTRSTLDQSKLSALERSQNVKGAFAMLAECKWNKILLIDDVFTTGATVNEASRVLKEGGATEVTVLTLTITPRRDLQQGISSNIVP